MTYIDKPVGNLIIRSIRSIYNQTSIENEAKADFVVLFNPGFTCPDYPDWDQTLQYIPNGTPFIVTTNTEMEGIADCQYLRDHNKIQSLPPVIAEIFGATLPSTDHHDDDDDDDDDGNERNGLRPPYDNTSFFSINPFCGSRVRQNGTMANDLFVKNRWILGGIMNRLDPSTKHVQPITTSSKKLKMDGNNSNTKANNPALI
jgi:hypothetical protein